jgi:hypothetical protein
VLFGQRSNGQGLRALNQAKRAQLLADRCELRVGYMLDRHAERLYFLPKYRDKFLRRVPRGVVYLEKKEAGQR